MSKVDYLFQKKLWLFLELLPCSAFLGFIFCFTAKLSTLLPD